jgi:hypothetical protein
MDESSNGTQQAAVPLIPLCGWWAIDKIVWARSAAIVFQKKNRLGC